jgi:hypothetical protein
MYQEETGNYDFQLADVARWAEQRGWEMPTPPTPVELLARQLQRMARTITRNGDDVVPYRVYHAYTEVVDGEPQTNWFDMEGPAATESKVEKALKLRREQALDVVVHIRVDENRWNTMHPDQKIQLDFDFNDEVIWRLNAPGEDEERKAG